VSIWQYTKSEVIAEISVASTALKSSQFQSGTWFLAGAIGKEIAREWDSLCGKAPGMTNDDSAENVPGFIAHRHDQSVLSLILKKHKILPEKVSTPFPNGSLLSSFSSLKSPIWAARNRTGVTKIPRFVRLLASMLP
jgi:hypothetical protein